MKTSLVIFLIFFLSIDSFAQQDPLFSHPQANQIFSNPAFAGSHEQTSLTAVYRHQWLGFEDGAPRTALLNANTLFASKNIGAGISLIYDQIGVSKTSGVNISYAYQIKLGNDRLSFGLNTGLINYASKWSDVATIQPDDPSFQNANENIWFPLFGAGAYYYGENYYAGISVPHLINYSYENSFQPATLVNQSSQYVHWLLSAGYVFELSDEILFKSNMDARLVQAAPVEIDLGMSLMLFESFYAGLSYRSSDAMIFSAGYRTSENFSIGYSYDYLLTRLSFHSSGSHELIVQYDLIDPEKEVKTVNMF